jgi:hypothetical protein
LSSTTTTDTIDYVVTDGAGLTSTSTRTVFIERASLPAPITNSPPIGPPTDSATLTATNTAQ